MSLYPSLEDMKVDQMAKSGGHAYPGLSEYMGLEFTDEILRLNMPEYLPGQQLQPLHSNQVVAATPGFNQQLVAPISSTAMNVISHSTPTNAIRQVVLCKDANGKVGMRVKDINKGVFVCLVMKDSPAALAGLRFGDQLLELNGTVLAGLSTDKVHALVKKCSANNISLAVRDRPFERAITLHKDSHGHIGFQFKDGEVIAIVKDSSAARNGMVIQHQMLEVNGQNVVGLKDKAITEIVRDSGNILTVTIMPSFVYKHMMKHMASSLTKIMDHALPML
ncbi:hypothetical protein HAZT_HAZT002460 [Hyalella azteca]|uniref:PDZ domain-containing protein n=1 Tax=Hyalella azteca TaxID=294128 RepID=A0A6A0H9U7_HYAAZ|nr:hypothetical protein HAZT_HAZT002460 [Hyalella azteca]